MPHRPPRFLPSKRLQTLLFAVLTCAVVAGGLACQSAAPAIPTVAPLTAPAPATPAPTPTEFVENTPTPQPISTIEPTRATTDETPAAAANPNSVSQATIDRAEKQTADLRDRMLRPREVDADFLWGMFITNRSFAGGWTGPPDSDYTTRMLEMWHADNACYSDLESEVARLGSGNNLFPLEFLQYMDHLIAQLSPCVDDHFQSISGSQFFDNTLEVRTHRVSTWFDRTWEDADDGSFSFAASCRDEFFSHLPDAHAATDSLHLESAWASAMVVVSRCALQAMQTDFAFLDISESMLMDLPLDDRYTTVSLQMTMFGHLLSINLRKPSDDCWPDYQRRIPGVAATADPGQMIVNRNAVLGSFQRCLEALPATNPYAVQ